jgi:archaellum biogenesis protein FlaJ (TadC family)
VVFLFATDLVVGIPAGIATFILVHVLAYSYLVLGANSRAAKVEDVLPDFLSLVASNIRSGLTPDKALIVSARDEFGPLSDAVNKAGKNSLTGTPLDQVIASIGENIHSNVMEKTTHMIVEGLHSGGDMSELLEKTALDIRKFRAVRKEVNSIILNYVLFIVAAITFGAPMLYGVSTFLLDIMLKIKSKIGGADMESLSSISGSTGIFKGKLMLSPEAVALFSSAAIIITVFFGCMAVGAMYSGKRMDGLKYFPILTLVALAILFAVRAGLSMVLGGMLAT